MIKYIITILLFSLTINASIKTDLESIGVKFRGNDIKEGEGDILYHFTQCGFNGNTKAKMYRMIQQNDIQFVNCLKSKHQEFLNLKNDKEQKKNRYNNATDRIKSLNCEILTTQFEKDVCNVLKGK